jgi:uncharacterized membrane protein
MDDKPQSPLPSGKTADSLTPAARENIDVLAQYQEQELAEVSRLQAAIERLSGFFGSPAYLVFVVVFILCWVGANLAAWHAGWRHVDEPPFFWLQGIVSSNALVLTVAVLIRQNRMSALASRRAHLDLHVNLLTERKVSKVLEMVQALQQQLGPQDAHQDAEADELSRSTDPQAILEAIKDSEPKPTPGGAQKRDG